MAKIRYSICGTKKDHEIIKKKAKTVGMSVSEYMFNAAVKCRIGKDNKNDK